MIKKANNLNNHTFKEKIKLETNEQTKKQIKRTVGERQIGSKGEREEDYKTSKPENRF